jgi:hypothetical protein
MDDAELTGPPGDQGDDSTALLVRALLFVSSYAPLFVILAIRFQGEILRGLCAGLAAIGFGYLAVVLGAVSRHAQQRAYPVVAVEDASGQAAGYLATYILPFVTAPSPSAADLAGYCILGLVALVIFMRSGLAQINPTLYVLGWRVAAIRTGTTGYYLVCRRLPRPSAEINAVRVAGLLVREEQREDGR